MHTLFWQKMEIIIKILPLLPLLMLFLLHLLHIGLLITILLIVDLLAKQSLVMDEHSSQIRKQVVIYRPVKMCKRQLIPFPAVPSPILPLLPRRIYIKLQVFSLLIQHIHFSSPNQGNIGFVSTFTRFLTLSMI